MENRIIELNNMLASYSRGNFEYKVKLSSQLDEIDTILSGVNMLGEELRETTVSRNFFSSIYNAVTNMLFVVDPKGIITDVNKTASDKLAYKHKYLVGNPLSIIFAKDNKWNFELIREQLDEDEYGVHFETEFIGQNNQIVYNSCACSKITDSSNSLKGYLVIAEDITEKKETEKLLVRTIFETQENERRRVANDLHDSLGQELSVIKMMLGSITRKLQSKDTQDIVKSCINILDTSISGIRNICFDLMPHVLQFGTIIEALRELITTLPIKAELECNIKKINFPKEHELMLYRVCQEFINNSLKYAEASLIKISIEEHSDIFIIQVSDNGKGFEIGKTKRVGRGSTTMRTRIESFGGKYTLESELNKGTKMTITLKR